MLHAENDRERGDDQNSPAECHTTSPMNDRNDGSSSGRVSPTDGPIAAPRIRRMFRIA
jgi:hypothetical protein